MSRPSFFLSIDIGCELIGSFTRIISPDQNTSFEGDGQNSIDHGTEKYRISNPSINRGLAYARCLAPVNICGLPGTGLSIWGTNFFEGKRGSDILFRLQSGAITFHRKSIIALSGVPDNAITPFCGG